MPSHDALLALDAELVRLGRIMGNNQGHRLRATRAGTELRRHELGLLAELDRHGPSRLTELAGRLQMELPHASRTARDLASAGLLAQAPDPDDGRATLLSVTRRGRTAVARYREASRSVLETALGDWPERRLSQLASLLADLNAAFAAHPDLERVGADLTR